MVANGKIPEVVFKEWDSCLFKKKIGSLTLDQKFSSKEIQEACDGYDLVYILLNDTTLLPSEFDGLFQITNVKFQKNAIRVPLTLDPNILSINTHYQHELQQLSYKSGEYSRFRKDSRFTDSEFRRLYDYWLNKSFEEDGNGIIGYFIDSKIAGFLSLSFVSGGSLKIELLAVSSEYQHQGIGKKLIEFTDNFAYKNECAIIEVITQEGNYAAVNFYLRNNFEIVQTYKIAHYWKKV